MKRPMHYKEAYAVSADFLNKVWFSPIHPESSFEVHSYPIIGERYNGAPIYAFLNLKLNQDKSSPDEGEITITVQDFIHGNWLYEGYFLSFVGKPNKSELAEHIKGICGRYDFTLIEKL